jgi:hypothetical protein
LTVLRAINAVETNLLATAIVQDRNRIAVADADDLAGGLFIFVEAVFACCFTASAYEVVWKGGGSSFGK